MTLQRRLICTAIIASVSLFFAASHLCLGQDSKPAETTTTQAVGRGSNDVEELRNQNAQLRQELDLLKSALADLTQDVQSLRRRSFVRADVHGAVLEYGDIFFAENRKNQTKTILFRNEYKSPPLVLVCESGTSGDWVPVKSERITTNSADIAVQQHFQYPCRIGYLVIGEGKPAAEAAAKKIAKAQAPREQPNNATPERKASLTENERKQLYWVAIEAQYRALGEADRRHPLPNQLNKDYSPARVQEQSQKRRELEAKLTSQYREEVAKKHGLTIRELDAIEIEGETKEWPTPPWEYGPPAVEPKG